MNNSIDKNETLKTDSNGTIQIVSYRLKVLFILWIGTLLLLTVVFYQQQKHNDRVDEIFEEYNIEMDKLHSFC
jgi:hypothetical protein